MSILTTVTQVSNETDLNVQNYSAQVHSNIKHCLNVLSENKVTVRSIMLVKNDLADARKQGKTVRYLLQCRNKSQKSPRALYNLGSGS